MNWIPYLIGNIVPQVFSSAPSGIEIQKLILFSMVHMMAVGFAFLYLIFRRDSISPRFLVLAVAAILYMCVMTCIISYLGFWSENSLAIPIIFISMFLTSVIAVAIVLLYLGLNSQDAIREWKNRYRYTIPVVAVLIFWELTMGFLYGSAFLPHTASPFLLAVNNVDFAAMMVIDAVFFLWVFRKKMGLAEFALFTFALAMALMPNFFIHLGNLPVLVSMIISALIMVVNIVLLYILQLRSRTSNLQALVLVLAACDLLGMIGLSLYAANQSLVFISSAMVVSMTAYFFFITHRLPSRPISSYRAYSFLLLVLINGAELAMSLGVTSLGFSITNSFFPPSTTNSSAMHTAMAMNSGTAINFSNPLWWLFPFDPVNMTTMALHDGLSISTFFAPLWSSFMLIMMTTMSPFYIIMMGSEMSYLVRERYRNVRNKSVKNWSLAIMAGIPLFGILVALYTSFYVFGMSGMLFAVSFPLFIISIAAIILASVFFGRRAQCNLVCMAAHMWTNVYYDQFKPKGDHQSVWNILRWTSFFVMMLSFGTFVLEGAGLLPPIAIGSFAIDPLIIYGMFVLSYIWWYFYFLTPVFGAYSCARQGWCGFGTLSGIFNKFFFKVRAIDRTACESCGTRECEGSCPTAIPLRSELLRKGSSNKIACVGCGDCVEACPQANLHIVDVRDYLRRNSGKNLAEE